MSSELWSDTPAWHICSACLIWWTAVLSKSEGKISDEISIFQLLFQLYYFLDIIEVKWRAKEDVCLSLLEQDITSALLKIKVLYWHLWFHEEPLKSMELFHSTEPQNGSSMASLWKPLLEPLFLRAFQKRSLLFSQICQDIKMCNQMSLKDLLNISHQILPRPKLFIHFHFSLYFS